MKQVLLNLATAFCIMFSLGQRYARAADCDETLRPAAFIVAEVAPPDLGDGQEVPDPAMRDPVWDFLIDKMLWDGCGIPGPDLNYMDESPETTLAPPLDEDQEV